MGGGDVLGKPWSFWLLASCGGAVESVLSSDGLNERCANSLPGPHAKYAGITGSVHRYRLL